MQDSPKIDTRSAGDIFEAAAGLLSREPLEIDARKTDPAAEALLRVFARYCELIIQRLNKAPNKNHAAFLDMLNISRIPPAAARVPLTFTPVKMLPGQPGSIMVPARTQVAAASAEGDMEPAVFETTRDVVLTNLELKKILALDPKADLYADKSYLADIEHGGEGEFVFEGKQSVAHELYLGHAPIFGKAGISTLRLHFEIEGSPSAAFGRQGLDWWIPTENGQIPLIPVRDNTAGLSQSGEVVFNELPQWPLHQLIDRKTNWLGCRLRDRLPTGKIAGREMPPKLPAIRAVMISAAWEVQECMVENAIFNAMPLDISKDFFPFGERPRFGDVFYLKCEAFSKPHAEAAVRVRLTNPASTGKDAPIPAVHDRGEPVIQWEFWNGQRWVELVCVDGTKAFIENGVISFSVPPSISQSTVNGLEGYWVRARLVSGNYGEDERFEYTRPDQAPQRVPATLSPPSIQSVTVSSAFAAGPEQAQQIVVNNNLCFNQIQAGAFFQPFQSNSEPQGALYLGFNYPNGKEKKLSKLAVDFYCHMRGDLERAFVRESTIQHLPELTWQYWNGSDWIEADTADETESLTRSGMVSVRTGDDIAIWREFSIKGEPCHWLRVLWTGGTFECPPKLGRMLVNTVEAKQATTIENELAGSSNGLANQVFRTARIPVLDELLLDVREPDLPSEEEANIIREQEGRDAIDVKRDRRGNVEQIWVRWHEVKDFISSTKLDRHFVVDRQRGEIRFGDGINGRVPPVAANNIRLRKYQTGGGLLGNKPAGTITQLRTSVAYVSSVTNLEPAFSGQDMEDWDSLRERGSRWLRHRGRAVTREDYEDLAKMASPVVAAAKCYPNLDLAKDTAGDTEMPGVVSLVVVPHSPDRKPLPDLNLLHHIAKFMNGRRVADTELIILAPQYVQVNVAAVIVATGTDTGAVAVAQCKQEISRYLHPLTGGDHGQGWEFGRLPHESDLYACLEAIRDLEYVRSLNISLAEERQGLLQSKKFLIYAGEPKIQLKW